MRDATNLIQDTMPLCRTLGITASTFTPEEVSLHIEWAPSLCTAGGVIHGGLVMALADSAGASCAFLNLPEGAASTSTIESKTNFFGPVTGGTITATSRPLHVGRSTIVVETELRAEDGRLVAKTSQTQAAMRTG
jgi:1,4-dihydroxy-2-naphthoyl-CoA hydrolase